LVLSKDFYTFIYLALQYGTPGQSGWGITMATDIAFVVGCLAVLGSRIPNSFRVLLLSLAIADDLGAIMVIAMGVIGIFPKLHPKYLIKTYSYNYY
jgi:Na+/H+ antiporter NhaA